MSEDDLLESFLSLSDDEVEEWLLGHRKHISRETVNACRKRAQSISEKKGLEPALHILDRCSPAADFLDDPFARALVLRGHANVLQRHERFEESLAACRQEVKLYEEFCNEESAAELSIAEARTIEIYVLGALERFEEAIVLAHWIRPRFAKQVSDLAKFGLANVASNLGQVYVMAWRLDEALQEHHEALRLYQELGEPGLAAWTLHDLGLTAMRMDRLDLAKRYYVQARLELEAAEQIPILIKTLFSLAEVCTRKGEYEEALGYLSQARAELTRFPDSPDHAFVDLFESQVRGALDQPLQTESLLRRALATFRELGRRIETAQTLVELGHLLVTDDSHDKLVEGLSCFEEAETCLQDLNMPLFTAWIQLEQGEILLRLGQTVRATERAEKARSVFTEANLPLRRAQADLLLADCSQRLQPREALQSYEAILRAYGDKVPLLASRCWRGLGRLAANRKDIDAAEQAYRNAFVILEDVRRSLSGHSHQAGFLEDKQVLIDELLMALHSQPGHAYPILGWVEQFKARVLVDFLSERPADTASSARLIELLEQREQLRHQFDLRSSSLLGGENALVEKAQRGPSLAAHDTFLADELGGLRRQLQTIQEQIAREQDEAHEWREAATLAPHDVHRLLGSHTVLVSYYTAGTQLFALTATNVEGDVQVHPLHQSLDDVEEHWLQAYRLAARSSSQISAVQARLGHLWRSLIGPFSERLLGKDRLLISPHRGLFQIPFAALFDAREGQYFVQQKIMQLIPSATVLQRCQEQPHGKLAPVLVGYPGHPDQPGYLPGVEKEIQTLRTLFPNASVLFGDQAEVRSVLTNSAGSCLVHLAGHILYDGIAPLESGMSLAKGRWLRAADLYLHHGQLDGATVVLSGCSAGRGRPTGSDVLGLTSAFLYAGAVGVVAGLWRVDDAATSKLMMKFHRNICDGADTAEALQKAQISMLRCERYAHPFFWAPFELSGDSRVLYRRRRG